MIICGHSWFNIWFNKTRSYHKALVSGAERELAAPIIGNSTFMEEEYYDGIGATVVGNKRASKLTAYVRCRVLLHLHSFADEKTTRLIECSNCRMAAQQEQGNSLKTRKTTGLSASYLPTSIWAKIACKMTITEWARACGTCRVTNNVQLDAIDIQQHCTAAGMQSCSIGSRPVRHIDEQLCAFLWWRSCTASAGQHCKYPWCMQARNG